MNKPILGGLLSLVYFLITLRIYVKGLQGDLFSAFLGGLIQWSVVSTVGLVAIVCVALIASVRMNATLYPFLVGVQVGWIFLVSGTWLLAMLPGIVAIVSILTISMGTVKAVKWVVKRGRQMNNAQSIIIT